MGLSVASLFGYRSGAIKISTKGWGKLEQAERVAGIWNPAKSAGSSVKAKESTVRETTYRPLEEMEGGTTMLREEPAQQMLQFAPPLEETMARIAAAMERLLEIEERKRQS